MGINFIRHLRNRFITWCRYNFIKIQGIINSDEIYVIKTIQGSKMFINIKDPGISQELLMTGVHEPRTTDLIKSVLKPGMKIIELGANVGYYTLIEAGIIGNEGLIYAFEPVIENYFNLQKNVTINNYNNVLFYNIAISDIEGKQEFTTTTASNWGSMVDHESDDKSDWVKERIGHIYKDSFEVETITIDNFLANQKEEEINLIRMDIEGYEIEAINGMKNTIKKMQPPFYILMEVHNNVFKDPIKSLGPTFRFLDKENMKPVKIIAKGNTFNAPIKGDWVELLLTENVIGVNHILLSKEIE